MATVRRRRQLSFDGSRGIPLDSDITRNDKCCELCRSISTNASIPEKWKSEEARSFVISFGVQLTSIVCNACRKDVARCIGDTTYTPTL